MKKFAVLVMGLLAGVLSLVAQTKVSGLVLSADDGMPIIGATVVVKGTTMGTVTDISGKFTLNVPKESKTLVFSYIGMDTKEESAKPVMRVTLQSGALKLDELVVTALGISKSTKSIGFASQHVSSDELTKSKNSDVISALSGKVAGVQISSSSGDPGSSNSIMIRGASSLGGNNQPLFVVDGVPMINNSETPAKTTLGNSYDFGNAASLINPNDVETMDILKGAAATALYGSRAANGVVMITTKSGKSGVDKLNVEFNSTAQMSTILRLPTFQNEYGMGWSGLHTEIENGSWGPKFTGQLLPFGNIYNNTQQVKRYMALENNVRDFFDVGSHFANDLSISGTSGKMTYYASFSALNDDGMLPTSVDTYDRYTIAARGSYDSKYIKVSSAINFANQANSFSPTGQGFTMVNSLYQTPRDISIVDLADLSNVFNTPGYFYTPYGVTNPYWLIENGSNLYAQNKTYGKMQVDIKPVDGAVLTYRFGFDYGNGNRKMMLPQIELSPEMPNAKDVFSEGKIEREMSTRYELNHDIFGNYSKRFGSFDFGITAGMNINERFYTLSRTSVSGLLIPGFNDLSNSAAPPTVKENSYKRRLVGVYGDLQVGYMDQFYLGVTARNDWSSTLPPNNNSFFYPGVTLSWLFSEALDQDWLTFGKLRVAWGQTGNDADYYMTNPYYALGSAYNEFGNMTFPFGGVTAYQRGEKYPSSTLSPELTTEYEAGLNLNFLKGLVDVDVSYYNRVSNQQIFALNVDPAMGYNFMNTNLGKIQNQGIELLVNVMPIKTRDWTWNIGFNFTKNNNKVLSLPKELGGEIKLEGFGSTTSSIYMMAREGYPMGEFKVTVPQRIDGKVVVDSKSGLPVADPDLQYVGDVNPDFILGANTSISYRGFTLSAVLDYRQGGLMYSRTKEINYFVGNAYNTLWNDRAPFIVPNSVYADGSENTTPVPFGTVWEYFQNGTDRLNREFLIDRTFIKLRNLVISYDFPKAWVRSAKIEGIRLSVYANNLFMWTPKDNSYIDPESSTFGNDFAGQFGEYSANPSPRTMGVSLNLKF